MKLDVLRAFGIVLDDGQAAKPPTKRPRAGGDSRTPRDRDFKLDVLRAFGIVLVVIWHIQPLFLVARNPQNIASRLPVDILNTAYAQVTLIGVPLFFIVSLYLFYSNLDERPGYVWRRIRRLLVLYLFWTFTQFVVYLATGVVGSLSGAPELALPTFTGGDAIVMGGPPLPIVLASVFYFLFNLLILTVLAFSYGKLPERIKMPLAVALVLLSLAYFEVLSWRSVNIPFWRIDNFLVYVPAAYMLKKSHTLHRLRYYLLGGFVAFSIHDILLTRTILTQTPMVFQSYGRVSVVLGALAAFLLVSLHFTGVKKRCIEFLSQYSLGIYATHKYVFLSFWVTFGTLFSLFGLLHIPQVIYIHDVEVSLWRFVTGSFAIAGTPLLVGILARTPLRRFVT